MSDESRVRDSGVSAHLPPCDVEADGGINSSATVRSPATRWPVGDAATATWPQPVGRWCGEQRGNGLRRPLLAAWGSRESLPAALCTTAVQQQRPDQLAAAPSCPTLRCRGSLDRSPQGRAQPRAAGSAVCLAHCCCKRRQLQPRREAGRHTRPQSALGRRASAAYGALALARGAVCAGRARTGPCHCAPLSPVGWGDAGRCCCDLAAAHWRAIGGEASAGAGALHGGRVTKRLGVRCGDAGEMVGAMD